MNQHHFLRIAFYLLPLLSSAFLSFSQTEDSGDESDQLANLIIVDFDTAGHQYVDALPWIVREFEIYEKTIITIASGGTVNAFNWMF